MRLRELRKQRNLTQRELAKRSGVNYRSLQDYEQGHKSLASANGDILLRLTTVLDCSIEELLIALDESNSSLLHPENEISTELIQKQRFTHPVFNVTGRWICDDQRIAILFYYGRDIYLLPMDAVFTTKLLPFLIDAALLLIEIKIEDLRFENVIAR